MNRLITELVAYGMDAGLVAPDDKTYTVLEMHRTRIPGLVRFNSGTVQTNVPANSEEYLASAYSANWRIPDPTWRYTSEPGLVEIQNEYGIKK